MKIDWYDLIVFLGLLLLGVGCWMISPALSLILVGLFLMAFGMYGAFAKSAAIQEDK
jgi:hypothetical protein